jgi:hypothetical protein
MKILVTGDGFLIRRYAAFLDLLGDAHHLEYMAEDDKRNQLPRKVARKLRLLFGDNPENDLKTARAFEKRSRNLSSRIDQLEEKPDLVFQVFGMYAPCYTKSEVPYTMYLDYTMRQATRFSSNWKDMTTAEARAWIQLETEAYQKATALFTFSTIVKEYLVECYDVEPEKIHVIFTSGPNQAASTETRQPDPSGARHLIMNGSEPYRKGVDIAIEALQIIRQRIPDTQLTIVGNPEPLTAEGVQALGKVKDRNLMVELLKRSDLAMLPSRCEPFQTFAVEAMSFGVPCIVGPVDGMPEMISEPLGGMVATAMEPACFAGKALRLLQDPALMDQVSKTAKRRAADLYTPARVADRIANVLSGPLAGLEGSASLREARLQTRLRYRPVPVEQPVSATGR